MDIIHLMKKIDKINKLFADKGIPYVLNLENDKLVYYKNDIGRRELFDGKIKDLNSLSIEIYKLIITSYIDGFYDGKIHKANEIKEALYLE